MLSRLFSILDKLLTFPGHIFARTASPQTVWAANHVTRWRPFIGTADNFRDLLAAPSRVNVRSVEYLVKWLSRCTYEEIGAIKPDHWTLRTFELVRRGDCKLRSLWAWKQLVRLGYDVRIVTGTADGRGTIDGTMGPELGDHVWIVFNDGSSDILLETTARSEQEMLMPLNSVRDVYTPYVAVSGELQMYLYWTHGVNRLRARRAPAL